jgi:hypothetical protein
MPHRDEQEACAQPDAQPTTMGLLPRPRPTSPRPTSTTEFAMRMALLMSIRPATESSLTYGTQWVVPRRASTTVAGKVVTWALSM